MTENLYLPGASGLRRVSCEACPERRHQPGPGSGQGGTVTAAAYLAIRPLLLERVVPAFASLGGMAFAYAQGSLVEGLATEADLDLVLVWDDRPPGPSERAGLALADPLPPPEQHDQPGFILDRFWAGGQQIDAKHVSRDELSDWVEQVQRGEGTTGYPMPVIALAGLLAAEVLADPRDECRALRERAPRGADRASQASLNHLLP